MNPKMMALKRIMVIGIKPKKEEDIPKDVDQKELKEGIKVEKEHTDKPCVAKKIALDHLKEDKKYYTKLKSLGL